jgi:folate-dependent phosphoribosylglycinamide formyltransferase PurN
MSNFAPRDERKKEVIVANKIRVLMKVGLLTDDSLSEFRLKTLIPILADNSFSIKVAVIDIRPNESLKQKLLKNIKRGRGGYILIMAFQRVFSKKGIGTSTTDFCKNNSIEIIKTNDPYSTATIENIRKYKLDIFLLISGYGIIKEPLLRVTPLGILSYHHGNMRKYRGQPPALWELYNNEIEMGVTVQVLSSGLDCGVPIEEKTIEIRRNDTLKKLQNRAYQESTEMMYNALKKLLNREFIPTKVLSFGKVYTLPNLRQWIILNIKILWRRLL